MMETEPFNEPAALQMREMFDAGIISEKSLQNYLLMLMAAKLAPDIRPEFLLRVEPTTPVNPEPEQPENPQTVTEGFVTRRVRNIL